MSNSIVRVFFLSVCFMATPMMGSSLKALEIFKGSWMIKSNSKTFPFKMTYKLASKGNIITEYFGSELSVFSVQENQLTMTHYCNQGIIAKLKRTESLAKKNEIVFKAINTQYTGKKFSAYIDRIVYVTHSKKHMDMKIVWKDKGSEHIESYVLRKVL